MSVFSSIGSFFKSIGSSIKSAFSAASKNGLTDEVVQLAESWIRVAATKAISDDAKRAFVVAVLASRGIPVSIANLAVELAYQGIKSELSKIPVPPAVPVNFVLPDPPVAPVNSTV